MLTGELMVKNLAKTMNNCEIGDIAWRSGVSYAKAYNLVILYCELVEGSFSITTHGYDFKSVELEHDCIEEDLSFFNGKLFSLSVMGFSEVDYSDLSALFDEYDMKYLMYPIGVNVHHSGRPYFEVKIPHESFNIKEGGEIQSIGCLFDVNDLVQGLG